MRALFDTIRRPVSLNGEWFLCEDREENGLNFQKNIDETYRKVNVPSDISVCFPERPYACGVFWYKKRFFAENFLKPRRQILHFEAVNHTAHVYVNGKYVGKNEQGYLPFELDVTDALVLDGENELTVRVDTRRRQGQIPTSFYWKNYGGILRDVWLYSTEKSYIEDAFVCANGNGRASFRVCTVNGEGAELHLCIRDKFGKTVAENKIFASGKENCLLTEIGNPMLWSPEDPNLYTAEITLLADGAPVDRNVFEYGYRDIDARDGKLWLNGKEIFLKGFNRHEDHPKCGGAANEEVITSDLEMIKASGANFIRMCHYPHDRRELELADRLGLCLLVEIPLCAYMGDTFGIDGSENKAQNELVYANACECMRRMIVRDRNHPSVIIWSVSNENNEPADNAVLDNHKGLIGLTKKLDATRLATHVSTYSTHVDRDKFFVNDDVICFNAYPVQFARVDLRNTECPFEKSAEMIPNTVKELRALYPGKPIIVTEFGYRTGVPMDSVDEELLQAKGVSAEFSAAAACANGASVWVFADHRWPNDHRLLSDISRFGLLRQDRTKKAAFDVYCELLKKAP
ncbi:MAG: hypothetical protein II350_06630 [Clostridia bacterium]|nr:hypothetical protein [Clostridia bacterium]